MSKLTHLDDKGDARMVDVSGKDTTTRTAMAEAIVRMKPETLALGARRHGAEGRRAGRRAHRRDHGGEEDVRADPALSSAADFRRHRRLRAR